MKNFILFFALLFSFSSFAQIEGTWNGAIEIPNQKLPFVLHVTKENGQYKATSDSPDQGVYGIAMSSIRFENNTLHLSHDQMKMTYEGTLSDNENIKGTFKQGTHSFTLNLKKEASKDISSTTKNSNIKELKVSEELYGDLYKTSQRNSCFINCRIRTYKRNGNTLGTAGSNSFKHLAEGLTQNDYVVLNMIIVVLHLSEGRF